MYTADTLSAHSVVSGPAAMLVGFTLAALACAALALAVLSPAWFVPGMIACAALDASAATLAIVALIDRLS